MRRLIRRYPRLHFWLRRIWFTLGPVRLPGKVGSGCSIHPTAIFEGPLESIELGDNVRVGAYAQIVCTHGSKIVVGNDCTLAPFSVLQCATKRGDITIGERCSVQRYSMVYGPIKIGNDCRIAAHVTFLPTNKNFSDPSRTIHSQGWTKEGIEVGDDVWVGAGVRVLDGVSIGSGSVLAAGAVITQSFPELSILAGVPAKLVAERGESQTTA